MKWKLVFLNDSQSSSFLTILISSVIASCNVQQFDCLIIITVITISLRNTSNLQIFAHELKIFIFPFYCLSTDVDECINNPCQHNCTNTNGSYTCKCNSCYTKLGTQCDLRQCKINNHCHAYGTVNPSNHCQVTFLLLYNFLYVLFVG